jgi:hypothetical protein
VIQSVFFLIRHLKAVPNDVRRQKLDERSSSAENDPDISSRHMQAGLGLKPGVVIAFKGYPQAVLIFGGHFLVVLSSSIRVKGYLPFFPALLKISIWALHLDA